MTKPNQTIERGKSIRERYKMLTFWHKVSFWGSIASILAIIAGLFFWLIPSPFQPAIDNQLFGEVIESTYEEYSISINGVKVSAREPIWGYDSLDEDEIVVKVSGNATIPSSSQNDMVVAFWRLANDYETNWHAGRRRDGGYYKLATLDSAIARSGMWDFLIGGIECKKEFIGDIMIVLLLYPQSIIDECSYRWCKDEIGWGFRELPPGYLAVSPTKVFNTTPTRK
jgi:hypothetical protein